MGGVYDEYRSSTPAEGDQQGLAFGLLGGHQPLYPVIGHAGHCCYQWNEELGDDLLTRGFKK